MPPSKVYIVAYVAVIARAFLLTKNSSYARLLDNSNWLTMMQMEFVSKWRDYYKC